MLQWTGFSYYITSYITRKSALELGKTNSIILVLYSTRYKTSKGSNQVTIFSMLFNKKVCYIAHPNVPNAGCPWSVQAVESLRLGACHVAVTISPGHWSPAVLA